MGWGLPKLKNVFKPKNLLAGALLGPTAGLLGMGEGISDAAGEIGGSITNLVTAGAIAQKKATEEAKKARDQAAQQYAEETAAAQETARKIAETEEERKRRLAMAGTQTPSTISGGGYLGFPRGSALKTLLG